MNYIGSKYSLLPEIQRLLDTHNVPTDGIALDLFAGTGTVAQFLKQRGYITYANDWQHYSYITCTAIIEHNKLPRFETLLNNEQFQPSSRHPAIQVLHYLNQLPGKTGAFYDSYCEGGNCGRLYFSEHNGKRIQTIRDQIELWNTEQKITPKEKAWLVASLIEGADKVANTASIYGAYLKRIKRSAQKPLYLHILKHENSAHNEDQHRAFCQSSETLLKDLHQTHIQLIYMDPPYNARQYNANYHILETLARWDMKDFQPRGVTGLRNKGENKSDYCSKTNAKNAFERTFQLINAEYVLFSYNNEGLLSKEELTELFQNRCESTHIEEIPYKRFRADNDGDNRIYKGDDTVEYLILGKLKK